MWIFKNYRREAQSRKFERRSLIYKDVYQVCIVRIIGRSCSLSVLRSHIYITSLEREEALQILRMEVS